MILRSEITQCKHVEVWFTICKSSVNRAEKPIASLQSMVGRRGARTLPVRYFLLQRIFELLHRRRAKRKTNAENCAEKRVFLFFVRNEIIKTENSRFPRKTVRFRAYFWSATSILVFSITIERLPLSLNVLDKQ